MLSLGGVLKGYLLYVWLQTLLGSSAFTCSTLPYRKTISVAFSPEAIRKVGLQMCTTRRTCNTLGHWPALLHLLAWQCP